MGILMKPKLHTHVNVLYSVVPVYHQVILPL